MFRALPLLLASLLFACGGDDSGDGDPPADAAPMADSTTGADAGGTPDAAPAGSAFGQACTAPADAPGQGDCPANYTCLQSMAGGPGFCTTSCSNAGMLGGDCAIHSAGACVIQVGGGSPLDGNYCSVACEDSTPNGQICGDDCLSCPSPLTCSGPIQDNGGNEIGKLCAPPQ